MGQQEVINDEGLSGVQWGLVGVSGTKLVSVGRNAYTPLTYVLLF